MFKLVGHRFLQKKETNIGKITFHLLSLTLFREYINMEFAPVKVLHMWLNAPIL